MTRFEREYGTSAMVKVNRLVEHCGAGVLKHVLAVTCGVCGGGRGSRNDEWVEVGAMSAHKCKRLEEGEPNE